MTTPVGKLPPLPPLKTSPQNSPAIISAPRSPTSSTHGDVDEVPPRSQLRAAYPSYKARVSASIPKGKRVSSSSSRRLSLTEDSSEFDPESEEESQRKYKHSGVAISAALDAHWKRARQVYHRPSRKNSSEIALFDDAVSNPMPKPGMKLRKGQKDPSTDQNAAIKLQSIRAEDAEHSDEEARRYLINPDDTYVPRPTHIGNMTDLYITNPSDDEDHEPERREEKISLTDALRSNPPTQRRDFETEKDPKNGKLRARFVDPPPPLDTHIAQKFRRRSKVSTPYPVSGDASQLLSRKNLSILPLDTVESWPSTLADDASLTMVNYHGNRTAPTIAIVSVPRLRALHLDEDVDDESGEGDRSGWIPKPSARYDDQKLFKAIRAEYRRSHGLFRRIMSARKLKSIQVLDYMTMAQLSTRHENPARSSSFCLAAVHDGHFIEQRMTELFHNPKLAHGSREIANWVCSLPENADGPVSECDKKALEFVEGWNFGKIFCALGLVILASIIAGVLWVFIGIGGQSVGFRDAGGRVQTGAALGLLTLLLGWTITGAWVLLSWTLA